MSRREKNLDNRTLLLPFGAMDIKYKLTGLLNEVARKSRLSREQIADGISRLTGHNVTIHMLNNYLGESDEKQAYNFPAHLVAAFCTVCGDNAPLLLLNQERGLTAVDERTLKLARLGRVWLEKDDIRQKEQALKWQLNMACPGNVD